MVVIFKESLPGGIDPFSWFELKSLTLIKYKEKIKYQCSCTFIIGKPTLHHGENGVVWSTHSMYLQITKVWYPAQVRHWPLQAAISKTPEKQRNSQFFNRKNYILWSRACFLIVINPIKILILWIVNYAIWITTPFRLILYFKIKHLETMDQQLWIWFLKVYFVDSKSGDCNKMQ